MIIEINDIRVYAFHGVFPVEQKVGQWYSVDLELEGDFSVAVESDNLKGTVDYGVANQIVVDCMKTPSKLVENVAGRIVNELLKGFPFLVGGTVCVRKMSPPVSGYQNFMAFKLPFKREQ